MSARATPAPNDLPPAGRTAEILDRTAELYSANLEANSKGRDLLRRLGLDSPSLIERHRIGYCDGSMKKTLPSRGRIRDDLCRLGILIADERGRTEEAFSGCLTFPLTDADGRTLNLCAEPDPDESPEAPPRILPDLPAAAWNTSAAKRCAELIVTESVLDALALEHAGIHNTVACPMKDTGSAFAPLEALGAGLTLLDCGAADAEDLPPEDGPRRHIHLADRLHPLEYLRRFGPGALAVALAEALNGTASGTCPGAEDLLLEYGTRSYRIYGLSAAGGNLRVTVRADRCGRFHIDTLNLYRAGARDRLCRDLVRLYDEAPETIDGDVARLIRACEEAAGETGGPSRRFSGMSPDERAEAEAFGRSPDLLQRIGEDFERCGLVGESETRLLCYLAAVSRRTDEPLSVLILSSSGAGKSALQNVTLSFCPPEEVVRLTSLSGKALFYQGRNSLKHRILCLAETAGAEEAVYAVRTLLSEGELVISTTVRDPGSTGLSTVENRVEGPTSVFCTTTDPAVDPETRSRFFVIGVDESDEQTVRVLTDQRKRRSMPPAVSARHMEDVRRVHRNFQRLLRPVQVINPYAPRLTYGRGTLQARREQPRYLALINAVAFLQQMSRPVKTVRIDGADVDCIEVGLDDIAAANRIAAAVLGPAAGEMSIPARDLLAVLHDLTASRCSGGASAADDAPDVTFTRRDVREFSGWSHWRVHAHLNELLELEFVLLDSRAASGTHRYRLAGGVPERTGAYLLGLTPVEKLADPHADETGKKPESGTVRSELGSDTESAKLCGKDGNSSEVENSADLEKSDA